MQDSDIKDELQTQVTSDTQVAAVFLRNGEIVAFPTETVFGLGADATNEVAISKVFVAKDRPSDNPLIVHLCDISQFGTVCENVTPIAEVLARALMPGPITLLLPRLPALSTLVTAGSRLVGVRIPRHDVALSFLEACARPVVAPSANRSGRPSPTSYDAVLADMDGRIACVLRGEPTEIGLESTVVDVSGKTPVIVRPGAITLQQIIDVAGSGRYASKLDDVSASPGIRYRHYSPRATVKLVTDYRAVKNATDSDAWIGLDTIPDISPIRFRLTCTNLEEYARRLFDFFRKCDAAGIQTIWCQYPPETGIGVAIADRLRRAAAH